MSHQPKQEQHRTNENADWSFNGPNGTLIILKPKGQQLIEREFTRELAKRLPERRREKNIWRAPEEVMHPENLYLIILFELVMYGRINLSGFIEEFKLIYGRTSIHMDEQMTRILILLDTRFD